MDLDMLLGINKLELLHSGQIHCQDSFVQWIELILDHCLFYHTGLFDFGWPQGGHYYRLCSVHSSNDRLSLGDDVHLGIIPNWGTFKFIDP